MASLPPVPSIRLLRFLRLQSENLSFFSPNHGAGIVSGSRLSTSLGRAARKVICPARKLQKGLRGNPGLRSSQDAPLQASILDIDSIIQSHWHGARSPRNACQKNVSYFAHNTSVRYNSSDRPPAACQQSWRERLWGFGAKRGPKPLEPDDLPNVDRGLDSNSMFNHQRQLSQKAALEPRLRCTEVDENGSVILVDGEFKKSELIARVRLLRTRFEVPRDDG